jgi:hypothetical protein
MNSVSVVLPENAQNKIIEKIKNTMNQSLCPMFISYFQSFVKNTPEDFVIDFDDVWKWIGFSQKIPAIQLLKKYFIMDVDYKKIDKSIIKREHTRGGHNKEIIYVNLKTFKLFAIKSNTKKSSIIQSDFIKFDEILQTTIQDENNECIEHHIHQINIKNEQDQQIKNQLERQQILLREFANKGPLIYIIKVKTFENGEYVIKLGESRKGIERRYNDHKSSYEEALLLDCFQVRRSHDFEKFLHHHANIRYNRVNNLQGHEKEVELFLIGKELSYDNLLQIIHLNIKNFDDHHEKYIEKLHIENELLRECIAASSNPSASSSTSSIQTSNSSNLQELAQYIRELSLKIDSLEKINKEILEKLNTSHIKTTTNFGTPLVTLGPRLQKINPETMTLVKVYESVSECINETNFVLKRPSINKAVVENTVYNGFRWQFVERDKDPNILENIQPTKKTRPQNLGYIAKVNSEKTEILNVYIDRKTAAVQNGFGIAAIDAPVKHGTPHKGDYYIMYDYCDTSLQQDFENTHGTPLLYRDGVGQYNKENELVRVFNCKFDCIKQLKMSDKTLAKLLDKDIMYNDHFFRKIGDKLSCL